MKTFKQLKSLIGYHQTDAVFAEYLTQLESADIINIAEGDIQGDGVSDALYEAVANVFGVYLDENLNPLSPETGESE